MRVKSHLQATVDRVLTAPYQFDYYGMERGGHNAVLDWILAGAAQPASFLSRAHTREPHLKRNHPNGFLTPDVRWPTTLGFTYEQDAPIVERPGRAAIVCVRDIRNMLASRLRWQERGRPWVGAQGDAMITQWREYARFALNTPARTIVFDHWHASAAYRARCAAWLQDLFPAWGEDPHTRYQVSYTGWGSSFDTLDYQGRAHEMPVRDRWLAYKDHSMYRALLTPAMLDLNAQLLDATAVM
jgi:hypothetical protein